MFKDPISEIIPGRYSCRHYQKTAISIEHTKKLGDVLEAIRVGPLGAPLRFILAAAAEKDRKELRGLGTYGLIRNPPGFIIGAVGPGVRNMEDFGYGMETAVLYAAGLGLGTCWLGGNFTRSTFTRKIQAREEETVPCVAAIGYPSSDSLERSRQRKQAKSQTRLPWNSLFFHSRFDKPLTRDAAGAYALPLEMLRLAPSSRNTQPWRVLKEGHHWHFYLARSGGYGPGSIPSWLLGLADLQRVDLGIAMCHFELTAREQGMMGQWRVQAPDPPLTVEKLEYVVSWLE